MVHGAGWIQNSEKNLLELLRQRFKIVQKAKHHVKKKAWLLDTTQSGAVEALIDFFNGKFKGMKAVEFSMWARVYRKHKGDFVTLNKIQKQQRQLRNRDKK